MRIYRAGELGRCLRGAELMPEFAIARRLRCVNRAPWRTRAAIGCAGLAPGSQSSIYPNIVKCCVASCRPVYFGRVTRNVRYRYNRRLITWVNNTDIGVYGFPCYDGITRARYTARAAAVICTQTY